MNEVKRFYCNPGSPVKIIYSSKLSKDGNIELVPVGEENIQDYIDSFAEETSINAIVARAAAGDVTALSKKQGMYGDFTEIPKTYRDILQAVIDGQAYFDSLPVDVKSKFDGSFEKWFTQIGSDEWNEIMFPKPVSSDESEVKDNA